MLVIGNEHILCSLKRWIAQMSLFEDYRRQQLEKEAPLAARMRPRSFEEFMGQEHIVGKVERRSKSTYERSDELF